MAGVRRTLICKALSSKGRPSAGTADHLLISSAGRSHEMGISGGRRFASVSLVPARPVGQETTQDRGPQETPTRKGHTSAIPIS